jgi:Family of unknown function (DUF5686)/CarboxypepD_reg-like domain
MRLFLFSLFFFVFQNSSIAQKVFGYVYNAVGDVVPYASVTVKGTTKGTSANDKGRYAFALKPGKYTLICQSIGYAATSKDVEVKETDVEQSFILNEQKLQLDNVVIDSKREDPAYEIMRKAIKKRSFYANQVKAFTCDMYTKDVIKLKELPTKMFGKKIKEDDKKEIGVDSMGRGMIYLSESISEASIAEPDKFKLNIKSSRVSGSNSFGFSFPQFISLYNSNVKLFTERLNPRGFVSPLADGAIGFYKFKFLGTLFEGSKSISSIQVTPRRKYEPLFTGVLNIVDDEWSIYSVDLFVTKTAQLELLDTIRLTQQHVDLANSDVRRVKNQLLHFDANLFGIKAGGNFVTVYSDYNINPNFDKKYFDNVIIKYEKDVAKKTTAYWDSARALPLEAEEVKDYNVKDSTFSAETAKYNSQAYQDSISKKYARLGVKDFILSGLYKNKRTKNGRFTFSTEGFLSPLTPNLTYNPAEQVVVNFNSNFNFYRVKSNSNFSISPKLRYGFGNSHFNPSVYFGYNKRSSDTVSQAQKSFAIYGGAGKRVTEFNRNSQFSSFDNSISTLFYGKNYLKTYENIFGEIGYRRRFENGLSFNVMAMYEDRMPLDNTSDYTFKRSKYSKNITPNYPIEQLVSQFAKHQALILNATIRLKPGQKYIQFPNYRVSVGSKYPTFELNYSKGVENVLGSNVNFDKWRFNISDDKNLKLLGAFSYRLGVGGFLNNKKVFIQDFQHFTGNRILSASPYLNSFQLAPYYAQSNTEPFFTYAHVEHHFNGLLTNKIPLFRKLNWNLVAGSNAFYVNKNNNYVEAFVGLENIFKVLRVDAVVGYRGKEVSSGIRLGFGGLLGGAVSVQQNNVSVSF